MKVGLPLCLALLVLPACKDEPKPEDAAPKKDEKTAAATAEASLKSQRHGLGPLGVTIELPADAKITETTETGALIEVDGAGLNVSPDTFEATKNTVKNFPFDTFTQWVKDEDTLAVAEMATGPNYRALRVFEVGEKTFVCSNVGTRGVATAQEAEKIVAHCESLERAK
jgi:hypothetical protein